MPQILPVLLGGDANVYGMARSFYECYGVRSLAVCRRALPALAHSRIVQVAAQDPAFERDCVFTATLLVALASLCLGSTTYRPWQLWSNGPEAELAREIVFSLRLPRTLAALAVAGPIDDLGGKHYRAFLVGEIDHAVCERLRALDVGSVYRDE